jgi:hypothetical protein
MNVLPLLLLGAAAAGAGYYLTRGSTSLPADLQTTFNQLLASGQNPQAMLTVADKLDSLGFHQEAAKLRQKAASLQAGHPVDQLPPKVSGRFDPMSHAPYSGLPYGATIGAARQMVCMQGCDLKNLPTAAAGTRGHLGAGAVCDVLSCVDAYCLVQCQGLRGWAPLSCLCPASEAA